MAPYIILVNSATYSRLASGEHAASFEQVDLARLQFPTEELEAAASGDVLGELLRQGDEKEGTQSGYLESQSGYVLHLTEDLSKWLILNKIVAEGALSEGAYKLSANVTDGKVDVEALSDKDLLEGLQKFNQAILAWKQQQLQQQQQPAPTSALPLDVSSSLGGASASGAPAPVQQLAPASAAAASLSGGNLASLLTGGDELESTPEDTPVIYFVTKQQISAINALKTTEEKPLINEVLHVIQFDLAKFTAEAEHGGGDIKAAFLALLANLQANRPQVFPLFELTDELVAFFKTKDISFTAEAPSSPTILSMCHDAFAEAPVPVLDEMSQDAFIDAINVHKERYTTLGDLNGVVADDNEDDAHTPPVAEKHPIITAKAGNFTAHDIGADHDETVDASVASSSAPKPAPSSAPAPASSLAPPVQQLVPSLVPVQKPVAATGLPLGGSSDLGGASASSAPAPKPAPSLVPVQKPVPATGLPLGGSGDLSGASASSVPAAGRKPVPATELPLGGGSGLGGASASSVPAPGRKPVPTTTLPLGGGSDFGGITAPRFADPTAPTAAVGLPSVEQIATWAAAATTREHMRVYREYKYTSSAHVTNPTNDAPTALLEEQYQNMLRSRYHALHLGLLKRAGIVHLDSTPETILHHINGLPIDPAAYTPTKDEKEKYIKVFLEFFFTNRVINPNAEEGTADFAFNLNAQAFLIGALDAGIKADAAAVNFTSSESSAAPSTTLPVLSQFLTDTNLLFRNRIFNRRSMGDTTSIQIVARYLAQVCPATEEIISKQYLNPGSTRVPYLKGKSIYIVAEKDGVTATWLSSEAKRTQNADATLRLTPRAFAKLEFEAPFVYSDMTATIYVAPEAVTATSDAPSAPVTGRMVTIPKSLGWQLNDHFNRNTTDLGPDEHKTQYFKNVMDYFVGEGQGINRAHLERDAIAFVSYLLKQAIPVNDYSQQQRADGSWPQTSHFLTTSSPGIFWRGGVPGTISARRFTQVVEFMETNFECVLGLTSAFREVNSPAKGDPAFSRHGNKKGVEFKFSKVVSDLGLPPQSYPVKTEFSVKTGQMVRVGRLTSDPVTALMYFSPAAKNGVAKYVDVAGEAILGEHDDARNGTEYTGNAPLVAARSYKMLESAFKEDLDVSSLSGKRRYFDRVVHYFNPDHHHDNYHETLKQEARHFIRGLALSTQAEASNFARAQRYSRNVPTFDEGTSSGLTKSFEELLLHFAYHEMFGDLQIAITAADLANQVVVDGATPRNVKPAIIAVQTFKGDTVDAPDQQVTLEVGHRITIRQYAEAVANTALTHVVGKGATFFSEYRQRGFFGGSPSQRYLTNASRDMNVQYTPETAGVPSTIGEAPPTVQARVHFGMRRTVGSTS